MGSLPFTALTSLQTWFQKKHPAESFELHLLAGDGSPRHFFRLKATTGQTYIVVHEPEWILTRDYPSHQAFLIHHQLPVPHFFYIDDHTGLLVMEDLGDVLLQTKMLEASTPKTKFRELLKSATRLLFELHARTYPVPDYLPVSKRRFDTVKYGEEFKFTFDHLVNQYFHKQWACLSEPLDRYLKKIALIEPLVFCHRDYHTRNLMWYQEQIYLIDFQDARLGSPHYDLASLLWDPYLPLDPSLRTELIHYYVELCKKDEKLGRKIRFESFEIDLELVAFQRLIKAAGSYASFFTRYQKQTHLKYIVPALKRARELQNKHSILQFLPVEEWLTHASKTN